MTKQKVAFKFRLINVFFVVYVIFLAVLSPFLMIPAFVLHLLGSHKTADRLVNGIARIYAKNLFFTFGIKVKVKGIECVPKSGKVCFISNHQGLADIPLIVGYIPKTVGFIAKRELHSIPILNMWMRAMKCVLIDRTNARNAVAAINKAIENIKNGYPMVIFPEGTRSRSATMGKFKPGSFKLVTGSNCLAVPVSISGTYKLVEESGVITPGNLILTIHPAIDVASLTAEEKAKLSDSVENIIRAGVDSV
ncbi:MAG TPA: lysophospholipid acyltransferase family protein [Bacteroidales bacterium]|nr:lysophospholipid acyltransferase family protein [Bacteroidales bacterium]